MGSTGSAAMTAAAAPPQVRLQSHVFASVAPPQCCSITRQQSRAPKVQQRRSAEHSSVYSLLPDDMLLIWSATLKSVSALHCPGSPAVLLPLCRSPAGSHAASQPPPIATLSSQHALSAQRPKRPLLQDGHGGRRSFPCFPGSTPPAPRPSSNSSSIAPGRTGRTPPPQRLRPPPPGLCKS
jgi:hypothetical protein